MSTFEPGTVATATVRGVPNVRVFRALPGLWVSGEVERGVIFHGDARVTDVRPLVVLNPEKGAGA